MKTIAIFVLCMLFSVHAISQDPVAVETVVQLETIVNEELPSISFYWNEIPGNLGVDIYRKSINSENWQKVYTTLPGDTVCTDDNVQNGDEYEYRIISAKQGSVPIETYVTAGIQCRETEYRGKVILLVDSLLADPLRFELSRLESDLIGDGWEIIRKNVSINSSVRQVKNLIREIYFSDFININTVFLVGHIPVPYSGELAFDGHDGEHDGAWPADIYYGDMNETFWTDSEVNNILAIHHENHNVPGDGKFDPFTLKKNQKVYLAVGRVDFNNLPDFSQSEEELMRNYLDKDHAFRHKIIQPKMQALVDDNFGTLKYERKSEDVVLSIDYEMFALSGWRNFTALFDFENVKAGKVFDDTLDDSYMWTYGCGPGTYTSCAHIGNASDFANKAPKTVFTAFYGSWFGDWNSENNFLRSALASNGWILTTCWAGRPHYVFHHMGMGETIGSCIRRTQNNIYTYYSGFSSYSRAINAGLMGDPTLRMHVVSPVLDLNSEISGNMINLSWNSPKDEIIGYYAYKLDTVINKYERLNNEIINKNYCTDVSPEQGNNYYMVRALQLTQSASGSYYNLSQGVFDTIQFLPTHISEIDRNNENEFMVYPNPATNTITIKTSNVNYYNINIATVNGQLLLNKEMEGNSHQIDLSEYPPGVYLISVQSKDFVRTKKIIKQ